MDTSAPQTQESPNGKVEIPVPTPPSRYGKKPPSILKYTFIFFLIVFAIGAVLTWMKLDVLPINPDNVTPTPTTPRLNDYYTTPTPQSQITLTPLQPDASPTYEPTQTSTSTIKLVSNPVPLENPVVQIYRPEIKLLVETLRLIKAGKDLPGVYGATDLITYDNYSSDFLNNLKANADAYDARFDMPSDIRELFDGTEAKDDITTLVYQAREDYISMLQDEGVDSDLIKELREIVFPADEDHLWVSYSDSYYSEYSFVRPIASTHYDNVNYTEAYMRFEMASSWAWGFNVVKSGILGPEPSSGADRITFWKAAREFGTRSVMYHEMTHVLQIAYRNLKVTEYGDTYTSQPLENTTVYSFVDPSMFWDTEKTPFTRGDNLTVSTEAQAELFEQYLLVKYFNLNEKQAQVIWDYVGSGARLNSVRDDLETIKSDVYVASGDSDEIDRYDRIGFRLGDVFDSYPEGEMKDFLLKIADFSGVGDQAYGLGYTVNYSDAAVANIFNHLKSL
ncbi:hypothetical protein KC614_03275 [candidate division WWE3 bacterium]|uniref:Uncharacterized protein n=1 Tax=candidate division WWE3 bacterium TaxID=2053526 RepID=A0A955LLQ9_UNCKA|nr:hypothetical protein [candidate division WWE3 bacterium]